MFDLRTREELLYSLSQNGTCRIVAYSGGARAIIEAMDGDYYGSAARVVSYVAEGSAAAELLDYAQEALEQGASHDLIDNLPVRYGPGASEWCLPQHPGIAGLLAG